MGLLCRIANDTARNSPAAPQARRQTVEKGKEAKEESGEKLAVAKPCIFAQQSASHAANAAKRGGDCARRRVSERCEASPADNRAESAALSV